VLGAGRPDETPPVDERPDHARTRAEMLARGASVTNCAFTAAIHAWAKGNSLDQIHSMYGVSCGEACRHIVRVADVLTELTMVYTSLGAEIPDELISALASIKRGLPFLRRGG